MEMLFISTNSATNSEDEDWSFVCVAEEEDLDSTFHTVNHDDVITEDYICVEMPHEENENDKDEIKEEDNDSEISELSVIVKENDNEKKESKENCEEENLLLFEENFYALPTDEDSYEISSEDETDVNIESDQGSSEEIMDGVIENKVTSDKDKIWEYELKAMIDIESLKEQEIYDKVEETDNFWLQYEFWDSKPSIDANQKKHKFFPKICRGKNKLRDWKNRPGYA